MDDRIEEVVKRSSEPLKDDWTLEQEVAQELRTHLEDKCAELEGEGNSPEESVKKAIGEFGDPDEIGRGLLGANFRRMKLRGKLKAVLRICGFRSCWPPSGRQSISACSPVRRGIAAFRP